MEAVLLAVLGVLMSSAARAQAQRVFEWRQPDGTAAYSQKPPGPGVGAVRESYYAAPPAHTVVAAVPAADQSPATPVALRDADARVARAQSALDQAEQAMRSGQQPLAGERQHLVNGHSRLTDAYFDRMAALENAVARARVALQQAQAERDALASD